MSPPLRILFVETDLRENGAIRASLQLASLLTQDGQDLRVAVVESVDPAEAVPVPHGTRMLRLAADAKRLRRRLPLALVQLVRAARGADVVVSGRELGWGLLLGSIAAHAARRPFAVIVHSDVGRAIPAYVPRRLQRLTFRAIGSSDLGICVSLGVLDQIRGIERRPRMLRAIPQGLDVAAVREAGRETPTIATRDRPLAVGLGRLAAEKGFDLLIRAHALVQAQGLEHDVVIFGEGPERGGLVALARELGVADSVTFPGFVANPYATVGHADVLCAPSRWDGYNRVLMEALVLGTPVIAADCRHGAREALDGGRYGALVEVEDVDGLARALSDHLSDPSELRRRAARGRRTSARFDARAAVRPVLEALREVSTSHVARAPARESGAHAGAGA